MDDPRNVKEQILAQIRHAIWVMNRQQDMEAVLGAMVDGLSKLGVSFKSCGVNLVDKQTDPPAVRSYYITEEISTGPIEMNGPGKKVILQIWQQKQTAYRSDLTKEDPYREAGWLVDKYGVRSVIDIPFAQGTLALSSPLAQAFSAENVEMVEEVAQVIAEGFARLEDLRHLERSRQELEEKNRLLAASHQIGQTALASLHLDDILDRLGPDVINAGLLRSLMLALVDEANQEVKVVRSFGKKKDKSGQYSGPLVDNADLKNGLSYDLTDDNIIARAARTGVMQVIDEWDARFDTSAEQPQQRRGQVAYFIPIKHRDRVLAVVATESTLAEKPQLLRRIEAMQPLLSQIAIALEHARLYDELQSLTAKQRREQDLVNADHDIRLSIASMDRPEDLCKVVKAIDNQLGRLGVGFDSCSIQIMSASATDFVSISASIPEHRYDELIRFLVSGERCSARSNREDYPWVFEVWRGQKSRYDPRAAIKMGVDQVLVSDLSLIDAAFSHGTLAINSRQPDAFGEKDIALVERFARILSEGFQRVMDLIQRQRAEAQVKQTLQTLEHRVETRTAELQLSNAELQRESREHQKAAAAFQQANERLKFLINSLPLVVFELDHEGIWRLSEGKGLHQLDRTPNEVVGQSALEVYREEPAIIEAIQTALKGQSHQAEFEVKDRHWWAFYYPVQGPSEDHIRIFGFALDITERKQAEDRLKMFAVRNVNAQEEERRRIARELHDGVCQTLHISASRIERSRSGMEDPLSALKETQEDLNGVSEELRRISNNLRSSVLDHLGLVPALREYSQVFSQQTGVKVHLWCLPSLPPLSSEVESSLYRIFQEVLSNVEKHAQANQVDVSLLGNAELLTMQFIDNGRGFDPSLTRKSPQQGNGLVNIQERVFLLNGRLSLDSVPGQGVEITIDLPLKGGENGSHE